MAVDTNELLRRIGAVLRVMSDKMDRLIEIGERPAREIQLHEMLEDSGEHEGDHFAGADKMVAEEPKKEAEPEHLSGPMPDPGKGYRILSKDPPEDLQEGDDVFHPIPGIWMNSSYAMLGYTVQDAGCWYRRKIEPVTEEPTKESAEHLAGSKPDPGEGYRILSKDLPVMTFGEATEKATDHFTDANKMVSERPDNLRVAVARQLEGYRLVSDDDIGETVEVQNSTAEPWRECTLLAIDWDRSDGFLCRHSDPVSDMRWRFARIKIEPAKQPQPAWEPKVGDWVKVTRPDDWTKWEHPKWLGEMHQFDGKTGKVDFESGDCFQICGFAAPNGFRYQFHRDWLTAADEPAKAKPEHPAGPKPDPGEGYRLLSKDPPEKLQEGDEYQGSHGLWIRSVNVQTHRQQEFELWYRRKIEQQAEPKQKEPPKPPEPEYRYPVLPADAGKVCEFSDDEKIWLTGWLRGYAGNFWQSFLSPGVGAKSWVYARIKKDA